MKHLYIITAFLFCCLSIIAQEQTKKESTITISGTVLDEFNAPIPGANVFLKDRPGVGTVPIWTVNLQSKERKWVM